MTLSYWFFVSLSSLCFATDEDGYAVENCCNNLLKCINNLHEEIFCLIVLNYSYKSELYLFTKVVTLFKRF